MPGGEAYNPAMGRLMLDTLEDADVLFVQALGGEDGVGLSSGDLRHVGQEVLQVGSASLAQGAVLKVLLLGCRWRAIQADVNEPVIG